PPTSLYILPTFWRTGENPREMRHSFSSQRHRESRLTPDSVYSVSILSVQSRNGSLQGDRNKRHRVRVEQLDHLGEICQRASEPVNLIHNHDIDDPLADVGQQLVPPEKPPSS